jgi:hypothetical protein
MAITLVVAAAIIVLNLLADLVVLALDPRVSADGSGALCRVASSDERADRARLPRD